MSNQVHAMRASISAGGGRPTMKDVASRAGVALKTVSRVVNGEPGVTPETARRVQGAIDDLGFRRNESARLLRTGRTATLGFIADTWTDPDQAAVYRGLESIAREQGYLLFTGSTDREPDREERLALAMCARRVDGLVIIPTPGSHDYLVSEIEAGVATVFALRPAGTGAGRRGAARRAGRRADRNRAPDRARAPGDRPAARRAGLPPVAAVPRRVRRGDDRGRDRRRSRLGLRLSLERWPARR